MRTVEISSAENREPYHLWVNPDQGNRIRQAAGQGITMLAFLGCAGTDALSGGVHSVIAGCLFALQLIFAHFNRPDPVHI